MRFTVVQGDIARQRADAIVNAAGTSLRMGSGVAGALRRAAGGPIDAEATSKGPVALGEVAVTGAYDLPADHVIHAAAMPHHGDGRATAESIRSAAENSLRTADGLDCESVVIPALGCGVAGFDLAEGAKIICAVVDAFEPSTLADVRFVAYSAEEHETVRSVARTFDSFVE